MTFAAGHVVRIGISSWSNCSTVGLWTLLQACDNPGERLLP